MILIKLLKILATAQGNSNMAEKISGVYKIANTATGDFYIGSSKDVKHRWAVHKCPSTWKKYPNKQLYKDMQKYGVEKFEFEILEEVKPESLKEAEQKFIEKMHPAYNSNNANGLNVERYKDYKKSDKCKESKKKARNKYNNQLCYYNGETLTLNTLSARFYRAGIEHYTLEAKKYIIKKESKNAIEFYDVYP